MLSSEARPTNLGLTGGFAEVGPQPPLHPTPCPLGRAPTAPRGSEILAVKLQRTGFQWGRLCTLSCIMQWHSGDLPVR